jgi:hypothetical protein
MVRRLYTFAKSVRNTEVVNALKARTGHEIEIRDKICIFFDKLLKRLSDMYKDKKQESLEQAERTLS